MEHGKLKAFEVSGEGQFVNGKPVDPPGEGPRFGRIFPHTLTTPPFTPGDQAVGDLGVAMTEEFDGGDSIIPAGYTYFGQFIDHDITRDDTPLIPQAERTKFDPDTVKQLRSPSLDLDSLYGNIGLEAPFIDNHDGFSMRLGDTSTVIGTPFDEPRIFAGHDIPRLADGTPDIGDDRNDENLIVQQTHNLFLRFHNKIAAEIRAQSPAAVSAAEVFRKARVLVTLHYQWLVLNDFVSRIVDPDVFEEILGTRNFLFVNEVFVNPIVFKVTNSQTPPTPLEFSVAAYRLGHSMVRETYSWNRIFHTPATFDLFFRFTHKSGRIGTAAGTPTFPSNWVADWRRMYELEKVQGFPAFSRSDIPLNRTRRLDPHLAPVLGDLDSGKPATVPPSPKKNLAVFNLQRGSQMKLQSGQDIADAIIAAGDTKTTKLSPADLMSGLTASILKAVTDHDFHLKSPLWYYVLKEAELVGGNFLGRAGSRIVTETFLAFIRCSITSIFSASTSKPGALNVFSPERDSFARTGGGEPIITMAHLIDYVGDVNPIG